jgi:peptide/nickel transport system substrate-binding protein
MRAQKLSRRTAIGLGLGAVGAVVAACGPAPVSTPVPPAAQKPAEPTKPAAAGAAAASTTVPGPVGPGSPTPAVPAGAAAGAAPTAAPAGAAAAPGKYKEAPELAQPVKDGKLPPVEQRLGKEPMVITPIEKVGVHGGQWRTGTTGTSDTAWFGRTIGYESLVRWDAEWKQLVPDIAKKYEVSPDGKAFTFYLRDGMKWSDGEPHAADDYMFWYEDVVQNTDITPPQLRPAWFTTAGKPGRFEKVDQYTFKMVFEHPNGTLLKRMAMLGAGDWIIQAKYAKKFHLKYNKDAVEKMTADQKLPSWGQLYSKMTGSSPGTGRSLWYNPDQPSLLGWLVVNPLGQGSRVVVRRNPYYWKVDPDGNQLPYLNEVVYDVVEKVDTLVLKALNGEIDMMDRHIGTDTNKAVFSDNKAKGQYDFFATVPDSMNQFIVLFNYNHEDKGLRDVIHNLKFRIGLSHAINRKEIIDTVFFGKGEPWQAAPRKESPFFHERLATQYLEYDVAKANAMLDQVGLDKKGADGIRLRPDGKPLTMTFETLTNNQPWIDTLELIKKYWKAVGVDINIKPEERGLRQQRVTAADHDVSNWGGDGGIDGILGPYWYFAYASFNSHASQWALWYETGGQKGEEPTAPAKKQAELYDLIKITPEEAKQKELMRQLLDIAADQFWMEAHVDGPGRGGAQRLAGRADLLRDHAHPLADRLDRSGARDPGAFPLAARGGLRRRGPTGRLERAADRPPPHGALDDEPHHRRADARDPGRDPGRDRAELPRARPAAAGRELGRAAAGGAEHPGGLPGAVAAQPGAGGDRGGRGAQLLRRRTARRGRPVRTLMTGDRPLADRPRPEALLEVKNLRTHFFLDHGVVRAVDGVNLRVEPGKTLGIVGESGCGKSITARSIIRTVEPPGRLVDGQILLRRRAGRTNGRTPTEVVDLARLPPRGREIRAIRGREIAMIFQEPMTSLSPHYTIGNQIGETLVLHLGVGKREARERTIDLLRQVGMARPELRVDDYPHRLSGGMRQRAMIAMAIACGPSLLIADEPTTALDVTTQAQILELLKDMQRRLGMAVIIITHDLGVIAETADDIAVMYLGSVVETADVDAIFHRPQHPYTRALLRSIPTVGLQTRQRLDSIAGMVPDPFHRPTGCTFHPRCPAFMDGVCDRRVPPTVSLGDGRDVSCLLYPEQVASA